jgi:hypothetical protein
MPKSNRMVFVGRVTMSVHIADNEQLSYTDDEQGVPRLRGTNVHARGWSVHNTRQQHESSLQVRIAAGCINP